MPPLEYAIKKIADELKAFGFECEFYGHLYKKSNGDGFERICLGPSWIEGAFEVDYVIQKRIGIVEKYWDLYKENIFTIKQNPSVTISIQASKIHLFDNSFSNNQSEEIFFWRLTEDEIDDGISVLMNQIRLLVLPFFSKTSDLNYLNRLFNGNIERYEELYEISNPRGLFARKMCLAALTKDPNYGLISDFCLKKIKEKYPSKKMEYVKIHRDLDNEIRCL